MKQVKHYIFVFLLTVTIGGAVWFHNWTPKVIEETVITGSGQVIDRAMSDGTLYLSIELADGSTVLCWDLYDAIPDTVSIGSYVEMTYGQEEAYHRNVVLEVTCLQ